MQITGINTEQNVKMLNPLSSDLNVMRQTLLFSGLETLSYNINRKTSDLRVYEFGKTYLKTGGESTKYIETKHLSVFMTGRKADESWNTTDQTSGFYTIKGVVESVFQRLGIEVRINENVSDVFSAGLSFVWNKRSIAEFGSVSKKLLKFADIRQDVFYADINWDLVIEAFSKRKDLLYKEVPKFPEVRRDLALLVDKAVKFEQLEQLAFQAEKNLLKSVNLFDVYQGDKLPEGKKSYAMSFTLLDENATLTDKQIEKIMEKLVKSYKEKAGAEIRS
jgi:phenylalanyl-tRNA synthetase beta chain